MNKLISKLFKKKQSYKERVTITIFVKDRYDMERYFKLFHFMFRDRIESSKSMSFQKEIITDELKISILKGNMSARGMISHFVMNLVQDKEFNDTVARPIERYWFLNNLNDPKFNDLYQEDNLL